MIPEVHSKSLHFVGLKKTLKSRRQIKSQATQQSQDKEIANIVQNLRQVWEASPRQVLESEVQISAVRFSRM